LAIDELAGLLAVGNLLDPCSDIGIKIVPTSCLTGHRIVGGIVRKALKGITLVAINLLFEFAAWTLLLLLFFLVHLLLDLLLLLLDFLDHFLLDLLVSCIFNFLNFLNFLLLFILFLILIKPIFSFVFNVFLSRFLIS
jgi:hypothetical protein